MDQFIENINKPDRVLNISRNTRAMNDVISRLFQREKCIYIRAVDNVKEKISKNRTVDAVEYRKITGKKMDIDAAFINFPSEWIARCEYVSQIDALILISSMYKELALLSNLESCIFSKKYELSTSVSLKTYILTYFLNLCISDKKQKKTILDSILHDIAEYTQMDFYVIKRAFETHTGIDILVKHTCFEDAQMVVEMVNKFINEDVCPSWEPVGDRNSVAFLSKAWENTKDFITDAIFSKLEIKEASLIH